MVVPIVLLTLDGTLAALYIDISNGVQPMKTEAITLLARTIPEYVEGYDAGRAGSECVNPYREGSDRSDYYKRRDWRVGYTDGEHDRVEFLAQGA